MRRAIGNRRDPQPVVLSRGPEYLVAHACFDCRKSWKVRRTQARCVRSARFHSMRWAAPSRHPRSRMRGSGRRSKRYGAPAFAFGHRGRPTSSRFPISCATSMISSGATPTTRCDWCDSARCRALANSCAGSVLPALVHLEPDRAFGRLVQDAARIGDTGHCTAPVRVGRTTANKMAPRASSLPCDPRKRGPKPPSLAP